MRQLQGKGEVDFKKFMDRCQFLVDCCEKNSGGEVALVKATINGKEYVALFFESGLPTIYIPVDELDKLREMSEYNLWMTLDRHFKDIEELK